MKRAITLALLFGALCSVTAQAHVGFGMVVDAQGRIVFLDSARSRVVRIEPDGRLTVLASGKHGNTMVQDVHGNLYFQNFNQSTWKLTPDGTLTEVKMPARLGNSGAVGSLDELLAVDAAGNLYVSAGNDFYQRSPQILKISPQGDVTLVAGSSPGHADGTGAATQFSHIRSAAWGPDGTLYVADGDTVRRVTLDGRVTTLARKPVPGSGPGALENGPWTAADNPQGFQRIFGIAVDARGNVVVADSDNFRVCRISPQGKITTLYRTRLPSKPTGVAIVGDDVYVMDRMFVPMPVVTNWFDTHRVRRIAPDGRVTTVVTVGEGGGYIVGAGLAGIILGVWWLRKKRKQTKAASAALQAAGSRT